ncbi:hypothetical protein [Sinomonas humi]|uniref:Uncharacterized protein n=1 Tax=Sinomonas humi TaxID=1338436 RepID=A0A0B2AT52_9MICC|nr:hypothetical protein [Sinomonas humi]KHL05180.1 hypothetical protein LK10_01805 [Sinomonas humi]
MIDWAAFVVVAIATVLGAGCIVLFFALGIRLGAESEDPRRSGRGVLAAASRACYVLSGAAVLFGVYLIVPYFH